MIARINKMIAAGACNGRNMLDATDYVVETIGLTLVRSRVSVLDQVDLAILPGEIVALMGANGAGKSTLLRCLAGGVRPDIGAIRWFGSSLVCSRFVRRQIGFVSHECGLYPELTAAENLTFAGRMYGVSRPTEMAKTLLASAGLATIADRLVRQLSQGVRQRVAIARALVHEPQLILLDEPFASVDEQGRRWLEQLFDQWRSAGRSVCFATHDIRQSRGLADRIVSLGAGRMIEVEPTVCVSMTSRRIA